MNISGSIEASPERFTNVIRGPWPHFSTFVPSPLLGDLRIDPDDVLAFTDPIAGFPQCRRYAILPYAQATRADPDMHWLQAMDAPFHTFLITDAWSADPDYEPEIDESDIAALGIASLVDASLYAIVTVSKSTNELTANLRAPLVVNRDLRSARQVVLRNGTDGDTRFRICDLP